MSKTLTFLVAALLWFSAQARAEPLPKQVTILPTSSGTEGLHQCSRATVKAESFWEPTPKEIWALEGRLKAFLAKPGVRHPHYSLADYNRQYVGVNSGGRRLIYGNFFHKDTFDLNPWPFPDKKRDFWRKEAVIVCDGGDAYWGIVFD